MRIRTPSRWGDWSILTRDDGTLQWAFRGKPVHLFAKEGAPGTTFGDSIRGPWHAAMAPVPAPPEATLGRTLLGTVLTNQYGLTLYRRDGNRSCDETCSATWTPLAAPMAAVVHADWKPVIADNGVRQWSYKGDTLYTYSGDVRPGDTNGDGVGKEWHAAVLEPPEPQPSWVTYTETDAGEILTNPQHLAIYTYVPNFGGVVPRSGRRRQGKPTAFAMPPAGEPTTIRWWRRRPTSRSATGPLSRTRTKGSGSGRSKAGRSTPTAWIRSRGISPASISVMCRGKA